MGTLLHLFGCGLRLNMIGKISSSRGFLKQVLMSSHCCTANFQDVWLIVRCLSYLNEAHLLFINQKNTFSFFSPYFVLTDKFQGTAKIYVLRDLFGNN